MNNLSGYIESGMLELYLLGAATAEEAAEAERLAAAHPEIREALDAIAKTMEAYADEHAVEPHAAVKSLLMAVIDYTERLKSGEPATFPPLLHQDSRVEDYADWLNRADMKLPENADELYAKLIGYSPAATTAIAWIRESTPFEMHDHEFERFLIVEGTCDFYIGEKVHHLVPGDFLEIPLSIGHIAKVTSSFPCKVILQRVAA